MDSTVRPLTLEDLQNVDTKTVVDDDLLTALFAEQHELSAVDTFSKQHNSTETSSQSKFYSRLMPTSPPGLGQQYAFEVDLDRCSGCKSCVTACHSLNGLDESETWRDVGLLIGGTASQPVMQHVTTACHHCLEPGCMIACPVNAYEKDPVTGIVRHLDDQCFGCQYCTLACPYDVPKYHKEKGIVRKCDMCADRLAIGEAPACVQACPHEAISIRTVEIDTVRENAEADAFLLAAPEPHLTLPTTNYKTSKVYPRNMLPADYFSINPQHPHMPLIIMLVLTQLSVGAFCVGAILDWFYFSAVDHAFRTFHAITSLILGLVALGASTLHLGRPLYAFRGFLGFRHSWLSREIVAFGLFAGLAVAYASLAIVTTANLGLPQYLSQLLPHLIKPFSLAVVFAGLLGVFCSVMIYVFTKREFWNFDRTLIRFLLTTTVLGLATTWGLLVVHDQLWSANDGSFTKLYPVEILTNLLVSSAFAKLLYDAMLFRHLVNFRNSPMKRSALLCVRPLARITIARFVCGVVGGLFLPLVLINQISANTSSSAMVALICMVSWLLCISGELLERYLFFAAVSAPRMPGGVRA